jgi:cell division protein FtsW
MIRPGQALILCVLALLTLGVVMVNSAGMSLEPGNSVTVESILLSRSAAYMVLAMIAMAAGAMLPVRRIADMVGPPYSMEEVEAQPFRGRAGPVMMWVAVGALLGILGLVYVHGLGHAKKGSHRWLDIGGLSVQPSEFAKWGLVVLMAWYGAKRAAVMNSFWRGLMPALAATGLVASFIVLEDLGTGLLVGMVAALVLLAAGARVWQMAALAPPALAMLGVAVASSPYRIKRLTSFLDPFADPERTGFHMIQSMQAVANGKLFGRGLGHGLQKFGYLPEVRTDFIFAVICEELGVAGAAIVVALYLGLLWAGYSILKNERSQMLRLVALGVLATVGLQALINLAVVTGLGPTKGIALPMLSSGGTGWILTAASLGLLVAMDRTREQEAPVQSYSAEERGVLDEPEVAVPQTMTMPVGGVPA